MPPGATKRTFSDVDSSDSDSGGLSDNQSSMAHSHRSGQRLIGRRSRTSQSATAASTPTTGSRASKRPRISEEPASPGKNVRRSARSASLKARGTYAEYQDDEIDEEDEGEEEITTQTKRRGTKRKGLKKDVESQDDDDQTSGNESREEEDDDDGIVGDEPASQKDEDGDVSVDELLKSNTTHNSTHETTPKNRLIVKIRVSPVKLQGMMLSNRSEFANKGINMPYVSGAGSPMHEDDDDQSRQTGSDVGPTGNDSGNGEDDVPVPASRRRPQTVLDSDQDEEEEQEENDEDEEQSQRNTAPKTNRLGPRRRTTVQFLPKSRKKKSNESDSDAQIGSDDISDDSAAGESGRDELFSDSSESSTPKRSRKRPAPPARRQRSSRRHGVLVDTVPVSINSDSDDSVEVIRQTSRRDRRGRARDHGHRQKVELRALHQSRVKDRPDYRIIRPELNMVFEEEARNTSERGSAASHGGGAGFRNLLSSMSGPIGPPAVGHDSDSSDDGRGTGGASGSKAIPMGGPANTAAPTSASLGQIKDQQALADSDPLGVDPNVSFDGVGGLDDHIHQLKEMVLLPLLYPEVFQRFKITPPRGVLFHGPPGTGKTLLARALSASVSSQGRKVTFYMRKGADALSKWVGEAERQLRLLFEDARKNQPSIIFFDEIDGLAPVRSSKQEQIHASIVATILALMDGMDGRGQVIVIGATNRPDNVDPALRRPGRFDREFYFPLPNKVARRAIIDIHTKGWEPPLSDGFKGQLSELTKGYGGADLRALCTEAALNAVQGTFPQIYGSDAKLKINPEEIRVQARDFMVSVDKLVPSSARSTGSIAMPLNEDVKPLLDGVLANAASIAEKVLPVRKKRTALEESQFERDDEIEGGVEGSGFELELRHQRLYQSQLFRPRLLLSGPAGNGQAAIASALLHRLEGVHFQSLDLAVVMADASRPPEAAIVQIFSEARQRKPSVLYVPDVDVWLETIPASAVRTFVALLRALPPSDAVMVIGTVEERAGLEMDESVGAVVDEIFGCDDESVVECGFPDTEARKAFFQPVIDYISLRPDQFPDRIGRRKRILPELEVVTADPMLTASADAAVSAKEQKAREKQKRVALSHLRLVLQPVINNIRNKFKKLRTPVISDLAIKYLLEQPKRVEEPPALLLTTDVGKPPRTARKSVPETTVAQGPDARPYELDKDDDGMVGLRDVRSGRFFYNIDTVTIEKRLSNGEYMRPADFAADIERLVADAEAWGEPDRLLKAREMLAHVDVDIQYLEAQNPTLMAEWEMLYQHEKAEMERRLCEGQQASVEGPVVETSGDTVMAVAGTVTTAPICSPQDTDSVMWDVPRSAVRPSEVVTASAATVLPTSNGSGQTRFTPRLSHIPLLLPTMPMDGILSTDLRTPDFASAVPTTTFSSLPDTQDSVFDNGVARSSPYGNGFASPVAAPIGVQSECANSGFSNSRTQMQSQSPKSQFASSNGVGKSIPSGNLLASDVGVHASMGPGTKLCVSLPEHSGPMGSKQSGVSLFTADTVDKLGPNSQPTTVAVTSLVSTTSLTLTSTHPLSRQLSTGHPTTMTNSDNDDAVVYSNIGKPSTPTDVRTTGSAAPATPTSPLTRESTTKDPDPTTVIDIDTDSTSNPKDDSVSDHPPYTIDQAKLGELRDSGLVSVTAGFSVERLLSLNAQVVQMIWASRTEWDRNEVIDSVSRLVSKLVVPKRRSRT